MEKYPWILRFIPIASKSIAEINEEYKNWNLGFSGIKSDTERIKFRVGKGVELALETYVCSTIVKECISSPLFSGAIIDENKDDNVEKGIRYWKIESEVSYKNKIAQKCDIVIQRYEWDIEKWGLGERIYDQVYIEAKRAYTGEFSEKNKKTQQKAVIKDIKKLQKEYNHLKKNKQTAFYYVLVWSTINDENKLTPKKYLEELNEICMRNAFSDEFGISIANLEYIPQKWINEGENEIPKTITESIWVCMFQIEFK
jgi:hypothetical protein